jgi:aminoglycoside phosphotransferase (APT) family kinase protein
VVVQRYRPRQNAEYRLRVMRALWTPAAEAGIPIPRIREFDLDADPPWVIFDALPGVPVPEAGEAGLEGSRFPEIARSMGELLLIFRRLPTAGLELDDLWADPGRLAATAACWAQETSQLAATEQSALADLLDRLPTLFAKWPVVLVHGDFVPVNVLTDGTSLTGLLDFESVRLADPLFDVAWWAWAVSFASPSVLGAAWLAFLQGAGIDPTDPQLPARVHALQVLRMLELVTDERSEDRVDLGHPEQPHEPSSPVAVSCPRDIDGERLREDCLNDEEQHRAIEAFLAEGKSRRREPVVTRVHEHHA